ncbi:MAG: ribonuclease P protein component [Flavobacteriia bacterium]|nr:ribonuclease P protein component [Flavobacteriia bacterium]
MTAAITIERLKSKTRIDQVFREGKSLRSGVLSLHYLYKTSQTNSYFFGVSVSKRNVVSAVKRNRIKRQMRSALRNNKILAKGLLPPGFYMLLFKGKDQEPYATIADDLVQLLEKISVKK